VRERNTPSPENSKSHVQLAGPSPRPFNKETKEKIDADVKRVREETDVPFDEIYHKERKLVQDIVRVQQ
jgi:hypothetical protein